MQTDAARLRLACPYRILMTADAVGGVWNYSLDLASQLCGAGAQVILATFGPSPDNSQRQAVAKVPSLTLVESDSPLEWTPGITEDQLQQGGKWLLSQSLAFQPDLVHVNGYFHAALPFNLPTLVVAHSCVYSWWRSTLGTLPPASWSAYRGRVSMGIAAAGAVAAPSQFMFDALNQIYSPTARAECVIHNFSNLLPLRGPKEDFILASGRYWDPAKNLSLLGNIAAEITWPIHLAGRTDGPNGERQECNGLYSLGELCRTQMAASLSRASIFVHPAKYEPFGLSVLEAAMNSCALVLSDIPSLRELWGDSALFAAPDDQNQWIEHVHRLIADRPLRDDLGAKAARHAKRYSPEYSVASYINLYKSLVSGASI